jgi:hypothetical protein|tara:strand:+ start:446 stop:673 length:228 start_codon:yes stop_codon:yes gene_type:complete
MGNDKKLELLQNLHTVLIENLLDKVKSGEAKAGDLNVARQLLKDNGIECIPTANNPMEDLMSNLPDLDVIPALER